MPLRATIPEGSTAPIGEASFRWQMNADAMATEKLAEGIRNFNADHRKLIALIAERL